MKILMAVHGFPPENVGGTESYVERLAQALLAEGHEVVIVAGTMRYEADQPRYEAFERADGLRGYWMLRADLYFDSWEKSYEPRIGVLFEEILRREQPDLVHVHHWVRLTRDLVHRAHRVGLPAVVTLHDLWATCLICFRVKADQSFCTAAPAYEPCRGCVTAQAWHGPQEIERSIALWREDVQNELHLARRCFVPSQAQGELVAQVMNLPSTAFQVLPHGLSADLPRSAPAAGVPGVDRKLRVACWSHLYPAKGQQVLLEALKVTRHRDQIEVLLLGECWDPKHRQHLEALAAGSDVRFCGAFQPADLPALHADLAVIPTLCHESYSFVVDEARAMGWPILATRSGALETRAVPGGALFPRGDARVLAGLLDQVIDDSGLLSRWREEQLPPDRFRDNAQQLVAQYAAVVAEGPSSAADRFDPAAHEAFEAYRSEQRYRFALRWSGAPEHIAALERDNAALRAEIARQRAAEGESA